MSSQKKTLLSFSGYYLKSIVLSHYISTVKQQKLCTNHSKETFYNALKASGEHYVALNEFLSSHYLLKNLIMYILHITIYSDDYLHSRCKYHFPFLFPEKMP